MAPWLTPSGRRCRRRRCLGVAGRGPQQRSQGRRENESLHVSTLLESVRTSQAHGDREAAARVSSPRRPDGAALALRELPGTEHVQAALYRARVDAPA